MLSDPVVGQDFCGRDEILDLLHKRVQSFAQGYRQNVAIISQPQMGKTSVIHQFLTADLAANILPLYISLQHADTHSLAHQICRKILYTYLIRSHEVGSEESLDLLMKRAGGNVPKTVEHIGCVLGFVKKREWNSAFESLLGVTETFYNETGLKPLIAFDEFHKFGKIEVRNPYKVLGKHLMIQKNSMYVFLSSHPAKAEDILAKKLDLLFGNFEKIYLDELSFEEADSFVVKKLEPVGISQNFRKYLIAFTDGHPFYLNVICRQLRILAESDFKPYIDEAVIIRCLKTTLFDAEGVLNQYFSNRLNAVYKSDIDPISAEILSAVSLGTCKLKLISSAVRRPQKEVSTLLAKMTSKGLLAKSGSFYHFEDRVFREWVSSVFRHRLISLHVDTPSKARQFMADSEKRMNNFIHDSGKRESERIKDLLESFSNDLVEIDSKTRRMPAFDKVEFKLPDANCPHERLSAESKNSAGWMCVVAHTRITEGNISEFISAAKHQKGRLKIILVGLKGAESSAKVIAKNKACWIVDLRDLNHLFEFYSMNKIVHLAQEKSIEPIAVA